MAVVVKLLTQRIVAPSLARSNRVSRPTKIFKLREIRSFFIYFFLFYLYIRNMKKILTYTFNSYIMCVSSTNKEYNFTSKKACDVTSRRRKDATKKTILKQILMKLTLMKPFNTSLRKIGCFYISVFKLSLVQRS